MSWLAFAKALLVCHSLFFLIEQKGPAMYWGSRRASLKVHVFRDYLLKKNSGIKEERPVRDIVQISVFPAQFAACERTFKADETRP